MAYAKDFRQFIVENYKTMNVTQLMDLTGLSRYHVIQVCASEHIIPLTGRVDNKGVELENVYIPKKHLLDGKKEDYRNNEEEKKPFKRPPSVYTNSRYIYKEIEEIK